MLKEKSWQEKIEELEKKAEKFEKKIEELEKFKNNAEVQFLKCASVIKRYRENES